MKKLMAVCGAVLLAASCSRPPDKGVATESVAVRESRSWIETTFDTLWTVGGTAADTLFGFPSRLTTAGRFVIISDPGFRRVVALHAQSGRVAWVAGGRADGANVFEKPLIVAAISPDTVAVVDDWAREFHLISNDGRILRSTALPEGRRVNAMCDLGEKGLLVNSTDDMGPMYLLDPGREAARPFTLNVPELADRHLLVLQAALAPREDRQACVIAMAFGTWMGLTDGNTVLKVAEYPENVQMPRVDSTTSRRTVGDNIEARTEIQMKGDMRPSALDVSIAGGIVHVLFGGRTQAAGRIIDEYDATTLEYRGSRKLPFGAASFTVPNPGDVVLIVERNGFPVIIALRERKRS